MESFNLKLGDTVVIDDCNDIHPELKLGTEGRVVGLPDEDNTGYLVDFWFTRKRIHPHRIESVKPKIVEPIDIPEEDYCDDDYSPLEFDTIDKPRHYNQGKFEPIDVINDWATPEQFEGFCWGNVIKYCSRYKHKGGLEDLKKARYYLDKLIETSEPFKKVSLWNKVKGKFK